MRHLTLTSITAELKSEPEGLTGQPGVHDLSTDGNTVRCRVDAARLDDVLKYLTSLGVRSLISQPPTIEELFLRHYGDHVPAARTEARL
jgi:ABC-2 type transport system ATP-binding protein